LRNAAPRTTPAQFDVASSYPQKSDNNRDAHARHGAHDALCDWARDCKASPSYAVTTFK
jgi:hypothetical protein